MSRSPLIAVDVGNSRIKLGLFCNGCKQGLPEPESALHLDGRQPEFDQLSHWLATTGISERLRWHIGSVNRPAASRLIDWLREHRSEDKIMLLTSGDLPIAVRLPRSDMVGVDRLLDAVAANRLRAPGRKAVVVDVGSAITVDLVDVDGSFLGGAILPGIAMSARALHEFTDLLPQIEMAELAEPPLALGTATSAAVRSGLFWGAVGAVRQLVEELAGDDAGVFLTGGAGPAVANLLGHSARFVPHLTLAGIALAADQRAHHVPP
jgi:type III pantothenate kinase